jgi:hypothetical protein
MKGGGISNHFVGWGFPNICSFPEMGDPQSHWMIMGIIGSNIDIEWSNIYQGIFIGWSFLQYQNGRILDDLGYPILGNLQQTTFINFLSQNPSQHWLQSTHPVGPGTHGGRKVLGGVFLGLSMGITIVRIPEAGKNISPTTMVIHFQLELHKFGIADYGAFVFLERCTYKYWQWLAMPAIKALQRKHHHSHRWNCNKKTSRLDGTCCATFWGLWWSNLRMEHLICLQPAQICHNNVINN